MLAIGNSTIFLVVGSFLYASYFGLFPMMQLWQYYAVMLVISILFSYIIVRHVGKIVTLREIILLFFAGIISAVILLFLRNEIPRYFYHKKQESINISISQFRQNITKNIEIGQPIFAASREMVNVPQGIDEFRFSIEFPVKIKQIFTSAQLLNALKLTFVSLFPKGSMPSIKNCYNDSLSYSFIVTPQLTEKENQMNPAGSYKLIFYYDFNANPKFLQYAKCQLKDSLNLQGEKVTLWIEGGAALGTYTIQEIQFH